MCSDWWQRLPLSGSRQWRWVTGAPGQSLPSKKTEPRGHSFQIVDQINNKLPAHFVEKLLAPESQLLELRFHREKEVWWGWRGQGGRGPP